MSFFVNWKAWSTSLFSGESRRQLMVSISSLAASGLFAVAIRFVGGIIQGRFVGPETLGYYTKFTILPGYMFFLHLGVFTSFARQYPYFIGKGDKDIAVTYASNALGWTYLLCLVHSIVFLIPCIWSGVNGDWFAALGWAVQIILSITSLYMFYLGSTYRNSSEFVTWSKATIISSIASLLFLPFVAVYHFVGLCVRYSLPEFISMFYAHWKRPLRIGPQLDRAILFKMIAFGFPLMIFVYISTNLWSALERTYILTMMDEKALGLFAFAGSLCAGLTTVARSISQVFQPRIAMLYGSSEKNMAVGFRYCIKCSIAGLAVMLPLVLLTYWLIDPLINYILPKYVECIPIARSLCWLALIPVIDLPKQLLIVANRTRQFGISTIISFLLFLFLLLIYSMVAEQITLQKIVIASVTCQLISVFISNFLSWHEAKSVAIT
jgi:O-antigen/teichoic acid export membrane protein